jgi:hypothetical protein
MHAQERRLTGCRGACPPVPSSSSSSSAPLSSSGSGSGRLACLFLRVDMGSSVGTAHCGDDTAATQEQAPTGSSVVSALSPQD